MRSGEGWNHSVHYHDTLLRSVPAGCHRVLDAGCGEGLLARKLATQCREVVAIDLDHTSLERARTLSTRDSRIVYIEGDVMTYPFPNESFDCITSIATLIICRAWKR